MPTSSGSGTLPPNQWVKVMWAWGKFDLMYQVFGSGVPFNVHMYTPFYSQFILPEGGYFDFSVIGYGEVWFMSTNGGTYSIVPA